MNNDLVSVIIPTYKRIEKLKACIESIKKSTYKNIEIIVINDDPEIDIKKDLERYKVRLLQNKKNMYMSYSKNLGAKISKGKFLFLLDDDNILDKDAISKLVERYNKKRVGVLGPVMYNKNGTLWFSGGKMDWIKFNPTKIKSNKILVKTDVMPNAAFISKKLFMQVNGYDESLPIHGEDVDLLQKLLKIGFDNFIYKKAITIHDYGKLEEHLTPKRLYFVVRSAILLEKRYGSIYKKILFSLYLIVHLSYYFIIYIPKRNNKIKYYNEYINGLKDGIVNK